MLNWDRYMWFSKSGCSYYHRLISDLSSEILLEKELYMYTISAILSSKKYRLRRNVPGFSYSFLKPTYIVQIIASVKSYWDTSGATKVKLWNWSDSVQCSIALIHVFISVTYLPSTSEIYSIFLFKTRERSWP